MDQQPAAPDHTTPQRPADPRVPHTPDQPAPRTPAPGEIDARLHPDGPPAPDAPRDPNRIENALHPDGRPAPDAPRDPNRIENALHPDGRPARHAPRDPNRIENALHPDGRPAPRDPNRIADRLNPERPRDPREDFMQDRPGTQPHGPSAPRDPREAFRQDAAQNPSRIGDRLNPDGPPAPRDPNRIGDRLDPRAAQDRGTAAPERQPGHDGQTEGDGYGSSEGDSSQGGSDGYGSSGDQDWTPGDSAFGVSDKPGFDPAFHNKALGDEFAPGVHDPDGAFQPKEREIADLFEAEKGWRLDARKEDHGIEDQKNPECMVRKDPSDAGSITEFKTMDPPKAGSNPPNAVKRNIGTASKQVPPEGEIVIDGRVAGLSEEDALRGFRKAVGQPGGRVAAKVHVILADSRIVTYVKEA
jgi:hypothetical protein